jgi:hypothetical protein
MTSFSSVQHTSSGTPRAFPQVKKTSSLGERREEFRCIAFRLLRRGNMKLHALLGHPISENFVSWCQTLKNSSASFLCIQEHLFHLPWFKNVYIWSAFVLCMMSGHWSRILSGKPYNTVSMARLKTLQFHLTLTPLFTATHTLFFLSFTIFFHDLWLGYLVYFRVTLDLRLILIHRDLWNSQKWQILISVNRDLDFFLLTEICDQNSPPPFKDFVYWKGVLIDLNLQTFFSYIFICILGGIRLSCLPLNCCYHQIGFTLKQVVPVSYYYYYYYSECLWWI